MLNTDAEADRFRRDAGRFLFFRRELAMGCRGGMRREGLGIADVNQAREDLQRVVNLTPASKPPLMPNVSKAEDDRRYISCARS